VPNLAEVEKKRITLREEKFAKCFEKYEEEGEAGIRDSSEDHPPPCG
jgi:hypothetical protein